MPERAYFIRLSLIEQAAALLRAASRPVIFAGSQVYWDGAAGALDARPEAGSAR